MRKYLMLALSTLAATSANTALAKGVAVEANVARAQSVWGAEVGVGYNFTLGGLTFRPIGGLLIHSRDNDRYGQDSFDNGQSRCRDYSNGRFVDDDKCNNMAVKAYAKAEATFTLAGSLELGAGARLSSNIRPYGTLSWPIAPRIRVKANGGKQYYALGLRADF